MRKLAGILFSVIMLALPAGQAAAQEQAPARLRIGAVGVPSGNRIVGIGLSTLAQSLGYFDDVFKGTNTKVEITYLTGTGPAINEALAQNQVDFGEYGSVPNVIGVAGNVPARLILSSRPTGAYYLAVRAGEKGAAIKTVKDLRGRKVAVLKGTNPHYMLVKLLQNNGLSDRDVRIINLQQVDAMAAFAAGSVDAIFGTSNALVLRDRGVARILTSTQKDRSITGNTSGFLVTTAFAQKYPDATRRVVQALVKASWWASQEQNRAALVDIYARTGIPAKYYDEQLQGPLKPRFNPLIDQQIIKGYDETAKFAVSHQLIRRAPDFRPWFDTRYLQTALKTLNLQGYWP